MSSVNEMGRVIFTAAIWIWANPLQAIGCMTGILGAVMLAAKCSAAAWAWPMWIVSNICWSLFAVQLTEPAYGLFANQLVFGVVNVVGTWTWMRTPRIASPQK